MPSKNNRDKKEPKLGSHPVSLHFAEYAALPVDSFQPVIFLHMTHVIFLDKNQVRPRGYKHKPPTVMMQEIVQKKFKGRKLVFECDEEKDEVKLDWGGMKCSDQGHGIQVGKHECTRQILRVLFPQAHTYHSLVLSASRKTQDLSFAYQPHFAPMKPKVRPFDAMLVAIRAKLSAPPPPPKKKRKLEQKSDPSHESSSSSTSGEGGEFLPSASSSSKPLPPPRRTSATDTQDTAESCSGQPSSSSSASPDSSGGSFEGVSSASVVEQAAALVREGTTHKHMEPKVFVAPHRVLEGGRCDGHWSSDDFH